MGASERIVLAGIDEAGLGPLLGSLAIGFAALLVPAASPDPWPRLRGTVTRSPGKRERLVVADSKIVFQRNERGARRLEATALSFLAQLDPQGRIERSAQRLLFGRRSSAAAEVHALPWSAQLPALPCNHELDTLELSSALLARALRKGELQMLDAGVRLVPAGELNASYAETKNKAVTVWARVLELIELVWDLRRTAPVRATVDMLGGRRRYGALLARAFPAAEVTLVSETRLRSAYALRARDGSGSMELDFRVQGERHSFPVALASCIAKYARELEMHAFNAYFAALSPELRPTAGYRGDGARWLAQANAAIEKSGLARELLLRAR